MSRLINYYGEYDKPVPEHIGGQPKILSCDIVVIGGGGAGLSAAARAAEQGAKVVLLEKMTELGGNTRMAGGLLCTNSKILQEAGVPDMTEEHIDLYRRTQKYQLNPAIYERFIRNTGTFYDWLASKGLDTENRKIIMDRVVMIRDRSVWEPLYNPAYGPGLMGSAVTDLLSKLVEESENVTVLLSTEATAVETDEYGFVTGVAAVGGGYDYEILTNNVILASGGFGCNDEMLKEYFPQYFSSNNYFSHYCLKHCTGDGIRMAEAVGAETGKNMSIGLEAMAHIPGAYILQRIIAEPCGIIVSGNGKRFMPEDDMENGEFAMDEQPDGLGWYLFSESVKQKMYDLAIEHARYGDWMPEIDQLYKDIDEELKSGLVVKGDTIDDLADGIGAPAEILRQTLENYEGFCAAGEDKEFRKDPQYLMSMGLEGPWYAVKLIRKFDVTMGGVTIDAKNRALRHDGSIIPGLYVCGDVASGWMGSDYGPLFSSFAWAVNSGFLTADEICASLNRRESTAPATPPTFAVEAESTPASRKKRFGIFSKV
ncbi:MAG: FAD-dependent oxidoreductase [Oscillospiraceae bacterium]